MAKVKPSIEEVKGLADRLETKYSMVFNNFWKDEQFYERNFKELLNIPSDFAHEATVLPTARDVVDTFVDHINIKNCRVFIDRNSTKDIEKERQEAQRRFYLGLLYMSNTGMPISQWRVAAKHFAVHGLGVMKTIYVPDKPFPILVQAVHPGCVMFEPSFDYPTFVIEKHKRLVIDMTAQWGNRWENNNRRRLDEEVDTLSFWNDTYRCELVDGEPVLGTKRDEGVAKHGYGFMPYVIFDSGQGNISMENDLSQRYVGILRHIFDLLVSESANYSASDILVKRETLKGGYYRSSEGALVTNLTQNYGEYSYLPDHITEIKDWETKMPGSELFAHMGVTRDYIMSHGAPPSVQGLSQQGVRSAAHYQQVRQEALSKYQYSEDAFKSGTQKVLTNSAKLFKNVVDGDIEMYFKDAVNNKGIEHGKIKKESMEEPFTCHVEFSPLTFEEEFQRHLDLMNIWNNGQGPASLRWVLERMPNVDADEMMEERKKEQIRNSPSYQQMIDQYMAQMVSQALGQVQTAQAEANTPPEAALTRGEHTLGGPHATQTPTQQMQGAIQEQGRRPTPLGNQGQGGGGNR